MSYHPIAILWHDSGFVLSLHAGINWRGMCVRCDVMVILPLHVNMYVVMRLGNWPDRLPLGGLWESSMNIGE